MKEPKFTDGIKWPIPYRAACNTDITVNWEFARKKLKEEYEERERIRRELQSKLTTLRRV